MRLRRTIVAKPNPHDTRFGARDPGYYKKPDDSRHRLQPGDKVYLAARFKRQAEMRALADEFVAAGFQVTSTWLGAEGLSLGDPAKAAIWADRDLFDIRAADAYVLISDEVLGHGGKDFEGGYAYALGKRVVVVGPRAHVFHHLAHVHHIQSVAELRFLYLNGEKIDD